MISKAPETNGAGGAVMIAGEAACAAAIPLYRVGQRDILHRADLRTFTALDASVSEMEVLVRNEVFAKQSAEYIGLELGKCSMLNINHCAPLAYLCRYVVKSCVEGIEFCAPFVIFIHIKARQADVAVGHNDAVACADGQTDLRQRLHDVLVSNADIVAAGNNEIYIRIAIRQHFHLLYENAHDIRHTPAVDWKYKTYSCNGCIVSKSRFGHKTILGTAE